MGSQEVVAELLETSELEAVEPEAPALPEVVADPMDEIQAWVDGDDHAGVAQLVPALKRLPKLVYEEVRKQVAALADIRVSVLDEEVTGKQENDDGNKKALKANDFEPWHEPVQLSGLLDELENTFLRFLVLPEGGAVTLALWTCFTHAWTHFDTLPILAVIAPEKRCGKSRTLKVLCTVVRRGTRCDNLTAPVLFRLVDALAPTVLLDEVDTYLTYNEELRGILNAGHDPDGVVYRCSGDDYDVVPYQAGSPKAIAGIGQLPGTVADRSIIINIRRKFAGEKIEQWFAARRKRELEHLGRKATRWAEDHGAELGRVVPVMPSELNDRQQDNWWPLFAIAETAGGRWQKKAEEAATLANKQNEEESVGTRLLADIKTVFDARGEDRLHSCVIVDELVVMEEAGWGECQRGSPLTAIGMANRLRAFGIKPRQENILSVNRRGYRRGQFEDAWSRYVADEGATDARTAASTGLEPETESLQNEDHSGYENAANPYEQRGLAGIAVKHYGTGRGEG
tara:strand:+ start:1196 stop:2734 length:1539 start_codon:yes stop_codon:yes gene_type:complete